MKKAARLTTRAPRYQGGGWETSKVQHPSSREISNFNGLELASRSFSGCWRLVFGILSSSLTYPQISLNLAVNFATLFAPIHTYVHLFKTFPPPQFFLRALVAKIRNAHSPRSFLSKPSGKKIFSPLFSVFDFCLLSTLNSNNSQPL